MIAKRVLNRVEFDDPLNIVSIHLFCGLWGLCAAGIFDQNYGVMFTNNSKGPVV